MYSGRLRDAKAKLSRWLGSKFAGATSRASALPHIGQTREKSSLGSGPGSGAHRHARRSSMMGAVMPVSSRSR